MNLLFWNDKEEKRQRGNYTALQIRHAMYKSYYSCLYLDFAIEISKLNVINTYFLSISWNL